MIIRRGDIVIVDLEPVKGSEQGKIRPCLVIQNDKGNASSPNTIIAAITSRQDKEYPFMVHLEMGAGGLPKDSTVLCNQIRTISQVHRISKKLGSLSPATMEKVDGALKISLALE